MTKAVYISYPTRREVERANTTRLNRIQKDAHTYAAQDRPGYDQNDKPISAKRMESLLERLVAPKSIVLKVWRYTLYYRWIGC